MDSTTIRALSYFPGVNRQIAYPFQRKRTIFEGCTLIQINNRFVRKSGKKKERKGNECTKTSAVNKTGQRSEELVPRTKSTDLNGISISRIQTVVPYWLQAYARIKISTFCTPYGLPDCNSTNGSSLLRTSVAP